MRYPNDASYSGTVQYTMLDKKPDRGLSISTSYPLNKKFTSQAGYEKSTVGTRRSSREFSIRYTNLPSPYAFAIENFFKNAAGDHETFEFDLTHINKTGNILVKFNSQLSSTQVLATDNLETGVYSVEFSLKESFS